MHLSWPVRLCARVGCWLLLGWSLLELSIGDCCLSRGHLWRGEEGTICFNLALLLLSGWNHHKYNYLNLWFFLTYPFLPMSINHVLLQPLVLPYETVSLFFAFESGSLCILVSAFFFLEGSLACINLCYGWQRLHMLFQMRSMSSAAAFTPVSAGQTSLDASFDYICFFVTFFHTGSLRFSGINTRKKDSSVLWFLLGFCHQHKSLVPIFFLCMLSLKTLENLIPWARYFFLSA